VKRLIVAVRQAKPCPATGIALTFTPDGQGHGLYTEAVPLAEIGALTVRRATRIEFDEAMQYWRVYMARGRIALFNSPSRQACLDWERQYLQTQEDSRHELPDRAGAVAAGA
jgi:hypothetical protein